jgi:hypothetical protein
MNTLYALMIACLSLQVWFGPSATPTTSINISEYSTAAELLAVERTSRDANRPRVATATPKLGDDPIESDLYIDEDGYTAAIIVPATPMMRDRSINTGIDYFADDAWDFKVLSTTELYAIQASDWW